MNRKIAYVLILVSVAVLVVSSYAAYYTLVTVPGTVKVSASYGLVLFEDANCTVLLDKLDYATVNSTNTTSSITFYAKSTANIVQILHASVTGLDTSLSWSWNREGYSLGAYDVVSCMGNLTLTNATALAGTYDFSVVITRE